jgi:protocatechuate 3,4-dioxygenase beta subunit
MTDAIIRIPYLSRRAALAGSLAALAPSSLAFSQGGRVSPTGACLLMPRATEGPYYFDPRLERSDIRGDRQGAPVRLVIGVQGTDCKPLSGARVDVWHCDAQGTYSGYVGGGQGDARGQTFLRGHQPTNGAGEAVFRTIYPGWYPGRTPHIHMKVILGTSEVMTSQLYFPDELSDRIYRDRLYLKAGARVGNGSDAIARGQGPSAMASVTPEGDGHLVRILVGVDPSVRRPISRGSPPDR